MDEWAWADPAELRIRLDVALQHAAELEADNNRLRSMLRRASIQVEAGPDTSAAADLIKQRALAAGP
ncbi:hypothetical protein, partial [Catenulispora pinisilvae]|uniref:hypothetical protein n=1 Tax=Catenulispora pinisilvae TaxID=2705253 RepID=UPI001891010C